MSIRRDIPLEEFEIIISPPSNRLASMCVNIYEDGKFNLNADSPVEAVKRSNVPILLIHGDDDRFVPHPMGCSIAAAAPETIEFHTISGAAHAMNYVTDPESYTAIVTAFTERCL